MASREPGEEISADLVAHQAAVSVSVAPGRRAPLANLLGASGEHARQHLDLLGRVLSECSIG